jgi:hypothetical protein
MAHAADSLGKANKDRFSDQEMANVQLGNLGNSGDRRHRGEVDPVSGMDLQTKFVSLDRPCLQPVKDRRCPVSVTSPDSIAKRARMQLDHLRSGIGAGQDLGGIGLNKQ